MNQTPSAPAVAAPDATDSVPANPPALERSAIRRLWDVFRREPVLLFTCSYVFVSFVGLWDSYWFYRRFDLPVLEYLQSSDYFVAGLRRPSYALVLVCTLLVSILALWPERWRHRNPERAARLDQRWWFRGLVPRRNDWWAYFGLHPETMTTLSAVVMLGILLFVHGDRRAERIRAGHGHAVGVHTVAGPVAGDLRLLGTSSAYLFIWDTGAQRAEVTPVEAVVRIQPRQTGAVVAPAAAPGTAR